MRFVMAHLHVPDYLGTLYHTFSTHNPVFFAFPIPAATETISPRPSLRAGEMILSQPTRL